MSTMTVVQELLRGRLDLPALWRDSHGAPCATAHEELTWSLVRHLIVHVSFLVPLPTRVGAGREQIAFAIDESTWAAFGEELGVSVREVPEPLVAALSRVLRREPPDPAALTALPRRAMALVALLDGFARHTRDHPRHSPQHRPLGFDDGTPTSAAEAVDELIAWAGAAGRTPDERYQIAYHVVWRPLVRRAGREPAAREPIAAEAAPVSFSLPLDFLQRARVEAEEPAESSAVKPRPWPTSQPILAQQREESPVDARMLGILRTLLDPLLTLRAEPAELLEKAESSAKGLTADVLRAWRRVLLSEALQLFGTPGAVIVLQLPDRAWRVSDGPFRPRTGDEPTSVRVVRRGVSLGGEVLLPGVVVHENSRG